MPETDEQLLEEMTLDEEEIVRQLKDIESIADYRDALKLYQNRSTTLLTELLMGGGLVLNVSDLHLEPEEEQVKLRARIDGMLQDVLHIPHEVYSKILSRLKILSKVKLNISDKPQDGRFSITYEGTDIEVRASSIPAEYGESVVMRLLNPENLLDMEELGLRSDLQELYGRQISRPNGMVILTGPTGSGKTTTLYAFLREIRNPEIKIITIEDPIEYHLSGISQTQADPDRGYDFASGLRSIVRQDPDVILVGEIRDKETAQIAMQAALTGHLVFSTVHTNDAAGTIARLQSLGAKLANVAPAINMAVAQRLVRRVCTECSTTATPTEEEQKKLRSELKELPDHIELAQELSGDTHIPKAKGCKACHNTGYSGRIGVFESFVVDEGMEEYILEEHAISEMRQKATEKGMVFMRQDGFLKVLQKITTIEEVERVTGEAVAT